LTSQLQLTTLVESALPATLELRRALHANPEPSYQEHVTTGLIADALMERGIQPQLRPHGTGLWVDVGGLPNILEIVS
jgi:amidohydrolase